MITLYNKIKTQIENKKNAKMGELRSLFKEYNSEVKKLSCKNLFTLVFKLFQSENQCELYAGIYFLKVRLECVTEDKIKNLDKLADHFISWGNVDDFSINILQPLLKTYKKETLELLSKWNSSNNKWKRRASLVSFTRKIGESGKFTKEALKLCDNLKDDPEDLVQKAVGWALKDNMRSHKEKVLKYIKTLRKEEVSSKIILYAIRELNNDERKEILNLN